MGTKTISIDDEAYARLKSVQKSRESFSQVIKRVVKEPVSVDEWLKAIDGHRMSRRAINAVEDQVKHRHRPRPRER